MHYFTIEFRKTFKGTIAPANNSDIIEFEEKRKLFEEARKKLKTNTDNFNEMLKIDKK